MRLIHLVDPNELAKLLGRENQPTREEEVAMLAEIQPYVTALTGRHGTDMEVNVALGVIFCIDKIIRERVEEGVSS